MYRQVGFVVRGATHPSTHLPAVCMALRVPEGPTPSYWHVAVHALQYAGASVVYAFLPLRAHPLLYARYYRYTLA